MAADIVPEINEKLMSEFSRLTSKDTYIRSFNKKLAEGTATGTDVSLYSEALGRCASSALIYALVNAALPDGKLYWNIVSRTVLPLFETVNDAVNEAMGIVIENENESMNIHLKAVKAELPKERLKNFLEKLLRLTGDDDNG
ncbi:MAG: hypothetical protein IJU01_04530 [Lachnospiraceae bacterium]|nr:hypothetical protein [Lachnospiraceae bacterium]